MVDPPDEPPLRPIPPFRPRRRTFLEWWFQDRRTGATTIAQLPNVPLWVFIGAAFLRAVIGTQTTAGRVLDVIASVALVVWAADEALRGVNPFRRLLGAVVLAWMAYALLTR